MAHEMMVGLTVTDDQAYQQYREAMAPLLAAHGGGFRYDFRVSEVLKSASDHPINRVFAIYFESASRMQEFFAHPEYRAIKTRFFERAVAGTTIFGAYER
ncbi:MAG: DUF1330 domain-containing protein [Planctomycetes bacterium]|nr:DUF1330 domain-containing protein [Planctomycetota bacterium]